MIKLFTNQSKWEGIQLGNKNTELFTQFERVYWSLSKDTEFLWKQIFEKSFPGSQSHILFLLERDGAKKMTELAKELGLTPGALTTASDKLIEKGFIARSRDEKDRRVVYLEMTEKGRVRLTELRNEGRKAMKEVFQHLTVSDLQSLINLFEQASNNIQHMREMVEK